MATTVLVASAIAISVIVLSNATVHYWKPIQRYAPWIRNYTDLIYGVTIGMFLAASVVSSLEQGPSLMTLGLIVAVISLIVVVIRSHQRSNVGRL